MINNRLLFVYGTLAEEAVQVKVLGRACVKQAAKLDGYKVCRGKWPYLVSEKRGVVLGWVLTDLAEADMPRLDAYEEVDRHIYIREQMRISVDSQQAIAWVYFPVLENWPEEWLERKANA